MKTKQYKEKICESCERPFVPKSGAQKLCPECRAKRAEKPVRPPTAKEVRARNVRQQDTIKALRDEIERLRRKLLAPQQALVAQIETLEKAIKWQKESIADKQRSIAAMGQRNHELRKAMQQVIEILQKALKENER